MPGVDEALRAAGIGRADHGARSAVRLECARLAHRVREEAARRIGLLPAGDEVAVPAIAVELGRALADQCARPVAVVDAEGGWPCARALVGAAAPDGKPLATGWLLDNLALLTPRTIEVGAVLPRLGGILVESPAAFEHLVVDLTGLDHLGEHLAAYELLDGVVLVARSGRTTTRQVRRAFGDVPNGRALGVLLTGL